MEWYERGEREREIGEREKEIKKERKRERVTGCLGYPLSISLI